MCYKILCTQTVALGVAGVIAIPRWQETFDKMQMVLEIS